MSKVCETWSLDDLCEMDEDDIEALLRYYKPGKIPRLQELRTDETATVFDGSFGWM